MTLKEKLQDFTEHELMMFNNYCADEGEHSNYIHEIDYLDEIYLPFSRLYSLCDNPNFNICDEYIYEDWEICSFDGIEMLDYVVDFNEDNDIDIINKAIAEIKGNNCED